jgi:hypothetical protein
MLLTVSNLPPTSELNRFGNLFGRYLYGFKPWRHCKDCFVARQERAVTPKMKNGPLPLRDELFYLCGVGYRTPSPILQPQFARRNTNIHLAVFPKKGSVASLKAANGATFVIEGAEAIAIPSLPDGFRGLPEEHYNCKMFQFGHEMFEDDQPGASGTEPVYQLRKQWIGNPGIRQDSGGRMSDPNLVR